MATDLQILRESIQRQIEFFAERNENVDTEELARHLTGYLAQNSGLVVKGASEFMERLEEAKRQESEGVHPRASGPSIIL